MTRTITIDPVTRIEGHAKITLHLDETGRLADARFHVVEYRGFETFCEGRPFTEMAGITARICGICPVSHLLAAAKTGDKLLAVQPPPAARKLRRMLNLAQLCQSHALSFFHLSSPDFLLGWDSDPAKRNIFGLIAADPELARGGIRLRQFGQDLIERLGGRKIHAAWAVPGGVRTPLDPSDRDAIRAQLPEAFATTLAALQRFKDLLDGPLAKEASTFGCFPSLFMGLVGADGRWEHYDGQLRLIDPDGTVLAKALPQQRISEALAEAVEPWTYLKFPYYKPLGPEAGSYRVGPLARLIEILAALEAIELLLNDPEICATHVRAHAGVNAFEAVGVSEAPRGTLFHHYRVDANGLIEAVNLIIATGQNNRAMNRTVTQIARQWITPGATEISEGLLNRVEAGIRCFDPCLSCSTHAAGQMPLHVQLIGPNGEMLQERWRQ